MNHDNFFLDNSSSDREMLNQRHVFHVEHCGSFNTSTEKKRVVCEISWIFIVMYAGVSVYEGAGL